MATTQEHKPKQRESICTMMLYGVIGAIAGLAVASATQRQDTPVRKEVKRYIIKAKPAPAQIPKLVASQQGSVVKVFTPTAEGSGVKIGPRLVVTAGHIMGRGDNTTGMHCHGAGVQGEYDTGTGEANSVQSWNGRYTPDNPQSDDIAMLRVRNDFLSFQPLPIARLSRMRPTVGSNVYFMNFETTPDNADRYPNDTLAHTHNEFDGTNLNFGQPAQYAGTVIGSSAPFLLVATGLRGYNSRTNGYTVNTFGGASGGPVFNAKGNVVGISDAAESAKDRTVGAVKEQYGVALPLPLHRHVAVSYVQLVSAETVRHYQQDTAANQRCEKY